MQPVLYLLGATCRPGTKRHECFYTLPVPSTAVSLGRDPVQLAALQWSGRLTSCVESKGQSDSTDLVWCVRNHVQLPLKLIWEAYIKYVICLLLSVSPVGFIHAALSSQSFTVQANSTQPRYSVPRELASLMLSIRCWCYSLRVSPGANGVSACVPEVQRSLGCVTVAHFAWRPESSQNSTGGLHSTQKRVEL